MVGKRLSSAFLLSGAISGMAGASLVSAEQGTSVVREIVEGHDGEIVDGEGEVLSAEKLAGQALLGEKNTEGIEGDALDSEQKQDGNGNQDNRAEAPDLDAEDNQNDGMNESKQDDGKSRSGGDGADESVPDVEKDEIGNVDELGQGDNRNNEAEGPERIIEENKDVVIDELGQNDGGGGSDVTDDSGRGQVKIETGGSSGGVSPQHFDAVGGTSKAVSPFLKNLAMVGVGGAGAWGVNYLRDNSSKLRDKVLLLEDELGDKSKKLMDEQKKSKFLSDKNKNLNDNITNLNNNITNLNGEIANLEFKNKNLNDNITNLKDKNKNLNKNVAYLDFKNRNLNKNVAYLEFKNKNLNDEIADLEFENINLNGDIADLEFENINLNDDIADLEFKNKNLNDDIADLEFNNKNLNNNITNLINNNITVLENENKKLNDNITDLINNNITVLENENKNLNKNITDLISKNITVLENKNKELNKYITDLISKNITDLNKNIADLNKNITVLEDDNKKLNKNITDLINNNITVLENENKKLNKNVTDLINKNITDLNKNIADLINKNITVLEGDNKKLNKYIDDLKDKNTELKNELNNVNKYYNELVDVVHYYFKDVEKAYNEDPENVKKGRKLNLDKYLRKIETRIDLFFKKYVVLPLRKKLGVLTDEDKILTLDEMIKKFGDNGVFRFLDRCVKYIPELLYETCGKFLPKNVFTECLGKPFSLMKGMRGELDNFLTRYCSCLIKYFCAVWAIGGTLFSLIYNLFKSDLSKELFKGLSKELFKELPKDSSKLLFTVRKVWTASFYFFYYQYTTEYCLLNLVRNVLRVLRAKREMSNAKDCIQKAAEVYGRLYEAMNKTVLSNYYKNEAQDAVNAPKVGADVEAVEVTAGAAVARGNLKKKLNKVRENVRNNKLDEKVVITVKEVNDANYHRQSNGKKDGEVLLDALREVSKFNRLGLSLTDN